LNELKSSIDLAGSRGFAAAVSNSPGFDIMNSPIENNQIDSAGFVMFGDEIQRQ
jgi:hypothetical protein